MFLTLLVVTFFIALIVSSIVARSSICHLCGRDFEWRPDMESRELHNPAAEHRSRRIDSGPLGARSVSNDYRELARTGMGFAGVFCRSADRVRHS